MQVSDAVPFVRRRDENERRQDYARSLSRWLDLPNCPPITFCENSGADLRFLRTIAEQSSVLVEFLQFKAPESEAHLGKGFGEMGILIEAFKRSQQLQEARHVVKVTGRLFVKNYKEWSAPLRRDGPPTVLCNFLEGLRSTDSRIFAATPEFYRHHLIPRRSELSDSESRIFEHALAKAVHQCLAEGGTWALPPALPMIVGPIGPSAEKAREHSNLFWKTFSNRRYALKRKLFDSWRL